MEDKKEKEVGEEKEKDAEGVGGGVGGRGGGWEEGGGVSGLSNMHSACWKALYTQL